MKLLFFELLYGENLRKGRVRIFTMQSHLILVNNIE